MQSNIRIKQRLQFLLVPFIFLILFWGMVFFLYIYSNAIVESVNYPSEYNLIHGSVIPKMQTIAVKVIGRPPAKKTMHALIGGLCIPVPTGWVIASSHKIGRQNNIQELKLAVINRPQQFVIIRCFPQYFEETNFADLANSESVTIKPFYRDTKLFLVNYQTPLSLYTAVAYAHPGMLHLSWGLSRWRADALLNLKIDLLSKITYILTTTKLTAFILTCPGLAISSNQPLIPRAGSHRFLFGCKIFDKAGGLKLALLKLNVKAANRMQALRLVVKLLSWASMKPLSQISYGRDRGGPDGK